MREAELVIDIGSRFTTVCSRGAGVIIREPSVVAISNRGGKMALLEAGRSAEKLSNVRQADFQILYPIKEGAIFHERAAALMYRYFIAKAVPYKIFRPKIKVIACVSCGLGNIEKRDVEKVLLKAGADEAVIIESPLSVFKGLGRRDSAFVIDIGASKSEIAICDKDGIIAGCSVDIGGDAINQAIVDYVIDSRRCKIKMSSAEYVKKQIASLYENDRSPIVINTEPVHSSEKVSVRLVAGELKPPIAAVIDKIVEVAYNLTAQIPEAIASDICTNGITLCGGSAYLPGLAEYIDKKLDLPVRVPDMPENAAAVGALGFFSDRDALAGFLNVEKL